jgi:RNA polymerase sigma factor (sigma-70 family)
MILDSDISYIKLIAGGMYNKFCGKIEYDEFVGVGNLALVESARMFKDKHNCSLKTYCDKRVRGAMIRYAQKELDKRRPLLYDDLDNDIVFTVEDTHQINVLDKLIEKELIDKGLKAVKKMHNKKVAKAIKLYILQEMPRREVSELLGVGEANVWQLVNRGIQHMQNTLGVK